MHKRVLMVAAHPDDEILGAGGVMAKYIHEGHEVYAVILGEGQTSRFDKRENALSEDVLALHRDSLAAGNIIGFQKMYFENLPDNRFDELALLDIIKIIEKYLRQIKPHIVYTHHGGDLNIDHRRTYEAVLTATRPVHGSGVEELYTFETLSSTEWNFGNAQNGFVPNVFCDIRDYIDQKCDAMGQYVSELCNFPHPRSIEGIRTKARMWGSVAGLQYAGAFQLIRKVEKN